MLRSRLGARAQHRHVRIESGAECPSACFDFSVSPIALEGGSVGGVLVAGVEAKARSGAGQGPSTDAETHERYRVLIEAAAEAVWETDAHGVALEDSPSWRAYTGQSLEEWLALGWLGAVHPDERASAEWQWRHALTTRSSFSAEVRLRSAHAAWRWTNVRAGPLRSAAGDVRKWIGMNLDIGARKSVELAVRESEARRTFLLALDDQIKALSEPRAIVHLAAQQLANVLGLPQPTQALDELGSEERWLDAVLSLAHPARRWTEAEKWLEREVAHRTWAAVARARAAQAVGRSEQRLAQALSIETVGVVFFKLDGRIVDANAAFERMSGYSREELMSDPMCQQTLTAPEFLERTNHSMHNLASALDTPAYEKQLLCKDGSRRWGLFAPRRLEAIGSEAECVEFVVDISEHKRLQAQQDALLHFSRAAHEQAERANKAKDEFLATVSHELRTPLAAILLWAAALRSGAIAPAEQQRAIGAIIDSAQSQCQLIEDLLDLSRLTAGKLRLAPASMDVEALVHAALDVVRPTAQARGVALELELEPPLGTAILDAARFKQILWNLLSNATKFTPEGGRATLRVRRANGFLEAEVVDTGIGIAPDFMPLVFERFRQADMGQTREHGGLGIGLALARHLVELQGGTIVAHSEGLGKGACLSFRLPWQDGASAPSITVAAQDATPSLAGLTVLLVEDDASTREAMTRTLVHAGAGVLALPSGQDALDALDRAGEAEAAPKIMVCDIG
jgi:PAS domain S-box-containing protein